jgi:ABC-type sugar transport system ATPase subunit
MSTLQFPDGPNHLSFPLPHVPEMAIISKQNGTISSMSTEPLIRAEELTQEFERHTAVSNLNLEMWQGEVMAFPGLDGAGKTTAVRMLTSILKRTRVRAFIAGYDVVQDARRGRPAAV